MKEMQKKVAEEKDNFILQAEGLTKEFPGVVALHDVTLRINKGEIRGLIGPNGAGKSTLLHLIIGKETATRGKIVFKGKDITDKCIIDIVLKGIGMKFQITSVFDDQTVYDNLLISAQSKTNYYTLFRSRLTDEVSERIGFFAETVKLENKLRTLAGELAYGEKQWLEMGMVLASGPELILLDEPTSGMSKEETLRTCEIIERLKGKNTFIVVEHDIEFIKLVSDNITVLNQGTVLADGSAKEIESNDEVKRIYLGEEKSRTNDITSY